MSQALSVSAERVGCSERTLRRCVNDGLLRGRRVARRRLELSCEEQEYLDTHWELLSKLRGALRTERAARMVVLFGSTATGEDGDSSDVDLLVVYGKEGPRPLARLQIRLRRTLGRPVDVVGLEQAQRAHETVVAARERIAAAA
jgi:predicted nucleotidyltransferase